MFVSQGSHTVHTLKEERVRRGDERNFKVAINVSVFSLKGYLRMLNYLSRSESPCQKQTLGMVFGTCKAFLKGFRPWAIWLTRTSRDLERFQVRHHSLSVPKTLTVTRSPKKLLAQMSDLTYTHLLHTPLLISYLLVFPSVLQPTPNKTKNTCANCQGELNLKTKALSA